ncbi:triose-phosphate isomerase [Candidatus Peregrinibacteria bacterium]|nr:triose-phosphate isomerase [Candidatus Peregrinibacteria bacterium]MBT4056273.1 triose-phosphate isomerase [Candidatus Peregrinibacteria bacterium]
MSETNDHERRPVIAGNWKMNPRDLESAGDLAEGIASKLGYDEIVDKDVIVIPPTPFISDVSQILELSNIQVGAQAMSPENGGAHTGEVSGKMLKSVGATHVLAGHSERRTGGETDVMVNAQVRTALDQSLRPILCVGEELNVREAGDAVHTVCAQVAAGLKGVTAEQMTEVIVAYEPVWAIGTGMTASPEDAGSMTESIRDQISLLYGEDVAQATRILYGGSVKPSNIGELMKQKDVDGALVGGASLKAESFEGLVKGF